jgi:hypothetical protein
MFGFALDFASANRPSVIGPNGGNSATGWIIGTGTNAQVSPNGVPMWLFPDQAFGLNYCSSPVFDNITIFNSGLGPAVYYADGLYGRNTNCFIGTNGQTAIYYDGFSYSNFCRDCTIIAVATQPVGLSACVVVMSGSQYCVVEGGKLEGGAWNLITNVYAGTKFSQMWLETSGRGGVLACSDGTGVSCSLDFLFMQDDLGWQGLPLVAGICVIGVINVNINNGFIGFVAGPQQGPAPDLIVDSCTNVQVNNEWFTPGNASEMIDIYGMTNPVRVNSPQAYVPTAIFAGYTTFGVTNGSPNVTASSTAVLLQAGIYVKFASQPNTTYKVVTVNSSTGAATITPNYSGTTNAATSATEYGFPWMPESGPGQGPLILPNQEDFGINVVNMIAATGMTLWINDFLWKVIQITDTSTLLSATQKVTLPLIAGYQRTFINSTAQLLTFGGATGSTISIAAGGHASGVCDGTNWIVTS